MLAAVTPVASIYRIVAADVWQRAEQSGSFTGTEHDVRDGFIHFSTAEQAAETAARHYAGQTNLLLLSVSVTRLGSALRWEPSRGGDLFPHHYGELAPSAIGRSVALDIPADGKLVLPDWIR